MDIRLKWLVAVLVGVLMFKLGPWVLTGEFSSFLHARSEEESLAPILSSFTPENIPTTCGKLKGEQIFSTCFKNFVRDRVEADSVKSLLAETAVAARLMQYLDEKDHDAGLDNHLLYSYDYLEHLLNVLVRLRNLNRLSPSDEAYRDVAADKTEALFIDLFGKTRSFASKMAAPEDRLRWMDALTQLERDFHSAKTQ